MTTSSQPRATVYLYSGAESLEMRLTELTADQLSLLYQLADSAGATGLAALAFELTPWARDIKNKHLYKAGSTVVNH